MLLEELTPNWQWENVPDEPLTPDQYKIFCRGYCADWEYRYEPITLGNGWHYIYRSGWLVKKFRYQLREDGLYHIEEHYTTDKEKGRNLLHEILIEGYWEKPIVMIE